MNDGVTEGQLPRRVAEVLSLITRGMILIFASLEPEDAHLSARILLKPGTAALE